MKRKLLVPVVLSAMCCVDASAVPFYGRSRSSQAQAQAESGAPGLMTDYTRDAAIGLSDFAFLARNFAGGNSSGNGGDRPGSIGSEPLPDGDDDLPASAPSSIALLALGAALLGWRRRSTTAKPI